MCKTDRLTAVLIRCDLRNDLRCDIAGSGKAVRLLDHCTGYHRTVLQHIRQIHQTAVVHRLCDIVQIMHMDDTLIMRSNHICREQEAAADVSADFARHIVTERAVDDRVLVGILLFCLLIVAFEQAQDLAVRGVHAALLFMQETILAVMPCKFVRFGLVQFIEYHVLDFFDMDRSCKGATAFFYITDNESDHGIADLVIDLCVCSCNRSTDLFAVVGNLTPVSFDDLHVPSPSLSYPCPPASDSRRHTDSVCSCGSGTCRHAL